MAGMVDLEAGKKMPKNIQFLQNQNGGIIRKVQQITCTGVIITAPPSRSRPFNRVKPTPKMRRMATSDKGVMTKIDAEQIRSELRRQSVHIAANTAKVGITLAQADHISANTAKVGITPAQIAYISTFEEDDGYSGDSETNTPENARIFGKGICITDIKGTILSCDKEYERITNMGYQMVGINARVLKSPHAYAVSDQNMRLFINNSEATVKDYLGIHVNRDMDDQDYYAFIIISRDSETHFKGTMYRLPYEVDLTHQLPFGVMDMVTQTLIYENRNLILMHGMSFLHKNPLETCVEPFKTMNFLQSLTTTSDFYIVQSHKMLKKRADGTYYYTTGRFCKMDKYCFATFNVDIHRLGVNQRMDDLEASMQKLRNDLNHGMKETVTQVNTHMTNCIDTLYEHFSKNKSSSSDDAQTLSKTVSVNTPPYFFGQMSRINTPMSGRSPPPPETSVYSSLSNQSMVDFMDMMDDALENQYIPLYIDQPKNLTEASMLKIKLNDNNWFYYRTTKKAGMGLCPKCMWYHFKEVMHLCDRWFYWPNPFGPKED